MLGRFGISLYLCSRVHAVRALRGREGMGHDIVEQRLTTLCFWFLEPEKFKCAIKNIAEWMLRVVYTSPVSVRRLVQPQAHFTGCTIYTGVGVICLL